LATDIKYEVVEYDVHPLVKGTPFLFLTHEDRKKKTGAKLPQVIQAYWGMSDKSDSVLWAKGNKIGIYVAFEDSLQSKADVVRLVRQVFVDKFLPAFRLQSTLLCIYYSTEISAVGT
jgi:hypothetical protein